MKNDFQTTASNREKCFRRIKSIVDLVQLDLESSGTSDGKKNDNKGDCWMLWSGGSHSGSSIISVNEGNAFLRKLFRKEREMLKNSCGCSSTNDDWSKLYLMLPTGASICTTEKTKTTASTKDQKSDFSLELKSLISNTHFDGFIILDLTTTIKNDGDYHDNGNNKEMHFSKAKNNDWLRIPPGLHSNICVSDSIIRIRSCRVYRNSFISRTFIGSNTVLINNGHISSSDEIDKEDCFAYGKINITVGAESGGGRSLSLTAESTMLDVGRQLKPPSDDKQDSDPSLRSPSTPPSFAFNIVSLGSIIRDTPTIRNVFLYPFSSIVAACSVQNSTLFSNAQISNASAVSNVLMQWNATISDNSKINNALMMEHSHCGPSSILESTIMGPDTHASAGEIHASVFGPNTNAHHQSLLVGVLWPLGRGNVAYGANVGSNHTGRLPDQECTAGEGIFWGLSCTVKLPIDLSMAPYSMVAAGTTLTPQRITMPFSLIVESSSSSVGNTRSHNDIAPGWVLQHTPYTLVRNDKKYATRRKATRHKDYTGWKILRPATVERCRVARNTLMTSLPTENHKCTPLQSVSGIGECQLTERGRDGGIKAYNNCIQLYALQGLLTWLSESATLLGSDSKTDVYIPRIREEFRTVHGAGLTQNSSAVIEWPPFPWDVDNDIDSGDEQKQEWEYQRRTLMEEFPIHCDGNLDDDAELLLVLPWIRNLLNKLIDLEKDFAERVAKSKRRDDTRGAAIIPGYTEFHVAAESDPVIVDVREKAKTTEQLVRKLLNKMKGVELVV